MVFKTIGNQSAPAILFFHAMGVTGESSMPVAEKLAEKYYCIMPTSTVYCSGQKYCGKSDEIKQIAGITISYVSVMLVQCFVMLMQCLVMSAIVRYDWEKFIRKAQ